MRISDWSSDVCSSDLAMQPAELDLDDAGHLLARQAVEQQDLVQAVEELRPEGAPHHLHHLLAHGGTVLPLRLAREDLGAEVGGQDDEGVAEVDGAALAVGQAAVVQDRKSTRMNSSH